MKTCIYNGILMDGIHKTQPGVLIIEDGRIQSIKINTKSLPSCDVMLDAKGQYICPGLIDTHTHGISGYDFINMEGLSLSEIAKSEAEEGVTGFLASLVCETNEDMKQLLTYYEKQGVDGFFGIHLEGPYLNRQQKAVMKEECLRDPMLEEFKEYLRISSKIKSMTIAPELPNAMELIRYGNAHGVVMMLGHSSGTAQDVLAAEKAGVKGITHLYNAMSQHAHRAPGVVTGAVLSKLMCELIVDGVHVHPDVVQATYKMIGAERIVLISDANPCKQLPKGEYLFSGKHVLVDKDKAIVKESGRIAGSTLRLCDALRNMCAYCGCQKEAAIAMASAHPAALYGWKKGRLEVGYDADIMIMDEQLQIHQVLRQGIQIQ